MKVFVKYLFICFAFVILMPGYTFAQIRVVAQVDTNSDIYVNSSFTFNVIIDGTNTPGQVDITPISEFNPSNPSGQDISSSSTVIINGKMTQNVTKRYVISYTLNCSKEGRNQIPPLNVTVDGKNYQTNPVQFNVLKPGTTDRLELQVELSEKQCYVGQPVIMSVRFYVMASIGDFNINIPALNGDDFYIEEPDITNPQARNLRIGNGLVASVTQSKTTHNNRDAILVSFSKVLIPKRAGVINIEPATISADVEISQSIFSQYRRYMVSSDAIQLNVKSLPEQDKPDGYYGLVGNYSISCSASPTEVSVGDPITLNIKIGGNKYLKPVQWPELEQIPGFGTNFKIPSEQASPVIENGYKVFTQTIRANNDNVTEIPSISLAYFDADKGTYVTAKTNPIKLEVSPTKILTGNDLLGTESKPANREVEAVKQGLSANYHDMDALQSHDFSPIAAIASPGYLVIWGGPFAIFLFSVFTKISNSTSPEKQLQKRKRSASGKAISQIKGISSLTSSESIDKLESILKQYIGERFDKTAGSLTSDDCYKVIVESSGDIQAAQEFKNIIADCEASRYASAGASLDSHCVNKAIDLILTIEKKSEK